MKRKKSWTKEDERKAWLQHYIRSAIACSVLAVALAIFWGLNIFVYLLLFFAGTSTLGALGAGGVFVRSKDDAAKRKPEAQIMKTTPSGFNLVEKDGDFFYQRDIALPDGTIQIMLSDNETRFRSSEPHALALIDRIDSFLKELMDFLDEQSKTKRFLQHRDEIRGLKLDKVQFFARSRPGYAELTLSHGDDEALWFAGYEAGTFERLTRGN